MYKPPKRKPITRDQKVLLLWVFNFILPGLGNLITIGAERFNTGLKMFFIGVGGVFIFHSLFDSALVWLGFTVGLSVVGVIQLSSSASPPDVNRYRRFDNLSSGQPKRVKPPERKPRKIKSETSSNGKILDSLGKDYTVSGYASNNFEEKVARAREQLQPERPVKPAEKEAVRPAAQEDAGIAVQTAPGQLEQPAGADTAFSEESAEIVDQALEIEDKAFDKVEEYSVESFMSGLKASPAFGGPNPEKKEADKGICSRCNEPRGDFMFCEFCGHSFGFE